MSQNGHIFHKNWFNRCFEITMKHFTKLRALYAACMENQQYCLHFKWEKFRIFFLETFEPPRNIVSHLMFIIWNFIAFFLIEYSLIGIVKPKFTRRNDYLGRKFTTTGHNCYSRISILYLTALMLLTTVSVSTPPQVMHPHTIFRLCSGLIHPGNHWCWSLTSIFLGRPDFFSIFYTSPIFTPFYITA